MCLAFPGTVIKVKGREAEVEYPEGVKKALIGEENIKIGDTVLVQMGVVVKKITATERKEILAAWKVIGK